MGSELLAALVSRSDSMKDFPMFAALAPASARSVHSRQMVEPCH